MPRSVSCLPTHRIPGAVIFRDDFNTLEYSKWHPLVGVIGYMLTTDHPSFTEQSMTSGKMDLFGKTWHSQFHIYKMVWTPDYIATYVDSHRIMYLEAGTSMYERGHFRGANIWSSGEKMAPFDQEFYLIMNVAVGGIGGTFTDSRNFTPRKPWRNNSPTAAKDFWNARSDWLASWNGNDAAMVVDWVQFRNL
ncbi:3-glucan binding protein [Elysia marginata]|uniref:3-glucan binding protein n=1 Tax=Elysia marginata TaxID=1093978 RepID=A0AAV4FIQ4_9GAST|nr:3-glucan binding protein [Elysia marginata]